MHIIYWHCIETETFDMSEDAACAASAQRQPAHMDTESTHRHTYIHFTLKLHRNGNIRSVGRGCCSHMRIHEHKHTTNTHASATTLAFYTHHRNVNIGSVCA